MTQPLAPRRPGRAVTKFSNRALFVGGGALTALVLGGVLLPRAWDGTPAIPAKDHPQEQRLKLPDVIARPLPPRAIPVTAPIIQDVAPVVPSQPDTNLDAGKTKVQSSFLETINPFATQPPPATKEAQHALPSAPPSPAPKTPPVAKEAPPRKGWAMLARPTQREAQANSPTLDEIPTQRSVAAPGQAGGASAQGLIQPARWAIPAQPLKTLYMSQAMPGRILDPLHSDLPGRLRIVLTVNILDKFGYDTVILPKDTLFIAQQVAIPQYGQTRLQVRLIQGELPSGEVLSLKAMVGDELGTNGLSGKVHNHYGKLLLAAGISAVLNIGAQAATGTPGPQQFFRNPLQDAAKDLGQGVQEEAQKVVDRELRVPPTIRRKAGSFCTITLEENLQFNQAPVVAR